MFVIENQPDIIEKKRTISILLLKFVEIKILYFSVVNNIDFLIQYSYLIIEVFINMENIFVMMFYRKIYAIFLFHICGCGFNFL